MKTAAEFGKYVRNWRKNRHLTLPKLAKMAKISKGLLSTIENGNGNPCFKTIAGLSKALQVVITIKP